ncbi:hypothetical protein GCM10011416_14300 [Polaribacter pacificus]|uniref:Lipoprotein n=1 Tax=Polaribacter pacificus TaxID=1775173 RepID=A0A917HY32_9FLAO|nr:hypothetical protein [Polaribacter pacificus]GGG97440.1 hypothetical protein GCM10011416_14300 [Polaribacter pacificus]
MRKTIIILTTFGLLLSCSPKIKSILEYQKKGDEFVPKRYTEFDKNGNKILSKGIGNLRSNRIITTEFKNGRKVFEKSCDYFKKQDTCVVRSFSEFEFNKNTGIEKETRFESDSSVRFIREIKNLKTIRITKVHTWEMFPTKNPKKEDAMILIDTTYLDNKGRKIKSLHYNVKRKDPWIEIFKYSENEYTKQTIGTARDTILTFKISDLQKMADKRKFDFKFYSLDNYKYEMEYY